ncbi:uncharacterized protein DFL_003715 [Arthrobotrys flagrans]|uniref:CBM1 domain-containing protein n=1 Tax=Arthrobotrys flagrans TaxID=97331 RepID=A0A437A2P9_ARTFL|nr:hypothetical protein DFL_003715 [Arthrobotrys flagrans]
MQFNLRHKVFLLSLLQLGSCWTPKPGQQIRDSPNNGRRRDLSELESFQDISFLPDLEVKANLEKRQDSTCTCLQNVDVFYPITTTSSYMATPYGECDVAALTSNLCPTDYICACQTNTTSICLPSTVQTTTACGTLYTGPTTRSNTTRWLFASIPTDLAAVSGQCGGTVPSTATTFWASSMTLCPVEQACVCQSSGAYSKCVDTTDPAYTGTACPNQCATVRQEFSVSLPPPSATAKLGGQCGGRCWRGPTNCPSGATCFTETSPIPGAYAACATANPGNQLRIRSNEGYEGINVPVKARAIATRIYF